MTIDQTYACYCKTLFPRPSKSDIAKIEVRIGVTLPSDFCDFLLRYNGGFFSAPRFTTPGIGSVTDHLHFLSGIRASQSCAELASESDLNLFDNNHPVKLLPIGYTMSGYLILLMTRPEDFGCILVKTFDDYFWLADGIEQFFELLQYNVEDEF